MIEIRKRQIHCTVTLTRMLKELHLTRLAMVSGISYLDRNDSFLETFATAIYTYCIAHAINKGWIDGMVYGPTAALGWDALSTKVNAGGKVEGVCVGTGMGFDPAFYYYRSVNVYAGHGYGPVLLAGGKMIQLLKKNAFKINDSALQYYPSTDK